MALAVTSYIGRDNTSKVAIYDELDDLQDLSVWDRCLLYITPVGGGGTVTLDTDVDTTLIALTATGIEARFGAMATPLSAGEHTVVIDLFDASHAAGFRVRDALALTMVAP